jgi:adenylate cyclase
MNLFFKSYKFYLFFFLTSILKCPLLLGHDTDKTYHFVPETVKFDIPADYNRSPNTSLIRTPEGVVFIGKHNGILTIDQDQIFFLPANDPVFVSLTSDNKVVYLTANDFGFVGYNSINGPVLKSGIKNLTAHYHDFYPSEISSGKTHTFLSTSEGIIVISDSITELFFFNRLWCNLHNTGHEVFLEVEKKGLFQWTGHEFTMVLTSSDMGHDRINSLVNWHNELLLFMEDGDCYSLNPENRSILKSNLIQDNYGNYQLISKLPDNRYIAINETNDLYLLSSSEHGIPTPLTESGHLPFSKPLSLFTDRFRDIWIIFDFNIFKIEYPSKFHTLDLSQNIKSTILSTAVTEKGIYLGTDDGLLFINTEKTEVRDIQKVSRNNREYFHLLDKKENLLIAAGNSGLYKIIGDSVKKIAEGNFSFIKILNHASILTCNETGLVHFRHNNGNWESNIIDTGINQVNSSAENNNHIWLQTAEKSILHLKISDPIAFLPVSKLPEDSIKRLLVNNNDLLLFGEKGLWKWDQESNTFIRVRSPHLTRHLHSADLIINSGNQLWTVNRNASGGSTIWMHDNESILSPFFEISGDKSFGQVINITGNKEFIYLTGSKKLIRLDTAGTETYPKDLLRIRSVELVSSTNNATIQAIVHCQKIKFSKDKICFNLADTRYQSEPNPYYRYKLTYYQDDWSEWTRNRTIVLENPRERKYEFQAQSVSSFGRVSDPVSYHFTVTPPFYRKWYACLFYLMTLLAVSFLIYKWRLLNLKRVEFRFEEKINERMQAVLSEKEKSDRLVADLFPKGTAEELKSKGRAQSKKFEMATVLFSDIQGFTKIAEEMNPEVLIDELDKFFFHFDSVVDKYNIEKIKTIGDAYMAAGGIPVKNSSNPVEVVLAGLEMQYYMKELKRKKAEIWDLRIGIHTGPVITGVVGHKKLSYDIWGDTVNTASRMESSGEGGKVNISATTYSLVKDFFLCEYRGKLPVKYKGNIDMYFVTGLRPELSVDLHGIPNRRFFTKLQHLKLKDLEESVSERISSNQLLNLHFHKKEFFSRVYNQTELLGKSENISDDEMLLAKAAAILLFSGLSETYENFENRSAEIARSILPEFGFDERQTERIFNLILATKEPFQPQNNIEAVLIDARMEFIGRVDYLTQVQLLYLEMKNMIKDFSKEKFIRKQRVLIKEFNFFTLAAQRLREITAGDQLKKLESWK